MTDLNQSTLQKYTDMAVEKPEVDTLIVGAGQAGVAMSEHLSILGVPHLVLERKGIAEAWRTGRWDSLVANGPAWPLNPKATWLNCWRCSAAAVTSLLWPSAPRVACSIRPVSPR